uniref:Uncharacterized protein n=1 Tax=Mycena chlorophos TaxID=658473 RepID=A0ABQ0L036_MYCCL|nr:predicted protein [Mycena chlorophos]
MSGAAGEEAGAGVGGCCATVIYSIFEPFCNTKAWGSGGGTRPGQVGGEEGWGGDEAASGERGDERACCSTAGDGDGDEVSRFIGSQYELQNLLAILPMRAGPLTQLSLAPEPPPPAKENPRRAAERMAIGIQTVSVISPKFGARAFSSGENRSAPHFGAPLDAKLFALSIPFEATSPGLGSSSSGSASRAARRWKAEEAARPNMLGLYYVPAPLMRFKFLDNSVVYHVGEKDGTQSARTPAHAIAEMIREIL